MQTVIQIVRLIVWSASVILPLIEGIRSKHEKIKVKGKMTVKVPKPAKKECCDK